MQHEPAKADKTQQRDNYACADCGACLLLNRFGDRGACLTTGCPQRYKWIAVPQANGRALTPPANAA